MCVCVAVGKKRGGGVSSNLDIILIRGNVTGESSCSELKVTAILTLASINTMSLI